MKLTLKKITPFLKHGIRISVYPVNRKEVGVVYVKSKAGHFQEFYDKKSTFVYYVLKGQGTFFLNDKKVSVKATDLIVIPPKVKIYYLGKMELLLTTVPAWQAKNEVHVRYIDHKKRLP